MSTPDWDEIAIQALSDKGAQCGDCGDQPGDRICPGCEKCRRWYVEALRAAGWAPRAESLLDAADALEARVADTDVDTRTTWAGMDATYLRHLAHQQPVGEPDRSFFQPGRTYTGGKSFRFQCVAISQDPATGEKRAIGWHGKFRVGDGQWIWNVNERTPDDWYGGAWTDTTSEQPAPLP